MPDTLRIDPWTPEYESAIQFDEDPEESPANTAIESDRWEAKRPAATPRPERALFIDGVRRIDIGLIDERDDKLVFGLLGSYAAGVAECAPGRGSVSESRVQRRVVLGAGIRHDAIDIDAGSAVLRYEGHGAPENNRRQVANEIQVLMRKLEGDLARSLANPDDPTFVDGPLTYLLPLEEPIVGYVKTHSRHYVGDAEMRVVASLEAGCRSPVFQFGEGANSRYSWYMRLAAVRGIEHSLAGIVRLEVSTSVGTDTAVQLADLSASLLPSFATTPGWDARAPQNLFPIAALEQQLRHLLGDAEWVRRKIEEHFHREAVAA